jgi:hypothetical protein
MEHFDIADMFGRRRKPRLTLKAIVFGKGQSGLSIVLALKNDGRASARAPYVALSFEPPFQVSPYGQNPLHPLHGAGSRYKLTFGQGADFTIHPSTEIQFVTLHTGMSRPVVPSEPLVIDYALACEDQPLQESSLTVSLSELQ